MRILAALAGISVLLLVLVDGFSTIVLARRSQHMFRLTRVYYRVTWINFSAIARRIESGSKREEFLSVYGPLSLLTLLAVWACGLIVAFGLLHWVAGLEPGQMSGTLANDFYISATTLFTLASGDPKNIGSKFLTVIEGGLGLSFLGLVLGYLPVLYQSFSNRERWISLLDARAGSPPSAAELLLAAPRNAGRMEQQLGEWEDWAAQVLENHLSFPMLAYFRSHHYNQSWLTALVAIVDASAILVLSAADDDLKLQAELTFAMGRHALMDMFKTLRTEPVAARGDRLPEDEFNRLITAIRKSPAPFRADRISRGALKELLEMYESQACTLSSHYLMALPPFTAAENSRENWRNAGPAQEAYAVSDPFQRAHGGDKRSRKFPRSDIRGR